MVTWYRLDPTTCAWTSPWVIWPIDALLHRAAANEFVHHHLALLADPKGTIGGLILHRRIPPAVEMDHMRCRGEVEPGTAGLEREHEERDQLVVLKMLDQVASPGHRRATVQCESVTAKYRSQKRSQWFDRFAKLGEHEQLFLSRGDHLHQLAQAGKLATRIGIPGTITQPLRRVIADLLEAHQERQHHAFSPNALRILERAGQILHRALIQRRLRTPDGAFAGTPAAVLWPRRVLRARRCRGPPTTRTAARSSGIPTR